jgi:AcrR family transcriptional regulator
MNKPEDMQADLKELAILKAAFEAFSRYGLKRTSMDDIAKGAGMSRPALYLRFAGKEDIFRALAIRHFEAAEGDVRQAIAEGGTPDVVLLAVMSALDGKMMEAMMTSPHAAEIIDGKTMLAESVVRDAEERIALLIAGWIADGVATGRLTLDGLKASPKDVALLLLKAKHGLKDAGTTFADYRAGTAQLAALFGKALTTKPL